MVSLPKEFVATKFAGYFYNLNDKKVYSIKSGILKPLKISLANNWNKMPDAFYDVSVFGVRRCLTIKYLETLVPNNSKIPVAELKI